VNEESISGGSLIINGSRTWVSEFSLSSLLLEVHSIGYIDLNLVIVVHLLNKGTINGNYFDYTI